PAHDNLVLAVAARGTIAVAKELGRTRNALSGYLTRHDLNERVREARKEEPTVLSVVAPERIKADQDAAVMKALKRENAEYAKALATQEQFFQRVVEATRLPVNVPKYRPIKQSAKKPTRSVICPIYDQQFGQFVRASDTPGNQGNFSVKVFDERLARWVEGVTSVIRQYATAYRLEELLIPFGGDHVEGDEIFAGQAWQLELDPAQQVWQLALKMDSAIREVVRFAKEEIGIPFIALYAVTGNHGRVGGKRGGARPATYNWDWLFETILFDRLASEPIDEFAIEPGGSLFFRCAGHEFQAIHGDQIRGWGGLPFYGLSKHDGRSIRMHSRIHRYMLMGHHHQRAEIPNGAGETLVSGDWVGANNLSGMISAASRPQQSVIFVAEKWGVTGTERIYFTPADEAYEPTQIHGRAA
ncbi:MAG: hypothetical protein H0U59_09085, partial [Gemmatimonadaceae bacterium]|nr:hypothetical protein [Gemmatimonadaceae bacterium]